MKLQSAIAISFRPLAASDLAMLYEWRCRPHVLAWWHDPGTYAEFVHEHGSHPADNTTQRYIALLGHEPLGFIQSYV